MHSLLLSLLLLTLPATTSPPDDDGDDDTSDHQPPVTYHARHGFSNIATVPLSAQPLNVWANVGYGSVGQYFDDEGKRRDLGAFDPDGGGPGQTVDTNAELASLVVHLGGAYDIYRAGTRTVQLGADLGLVRRTLTSEAVDLPGPNSIPEQNFSSGLASQNLTLFSTLTAERYTARVGYLLDLGPEDDPNDSEDYSNSDEQDAVQVGVSSQYPAGNYRLYGGLDYFLTLESKRGPNDTAYDEGDVLNLHAGGALRFAEAFELGLTLLYRINTEGHVGGTSGGNLPASASLGAPNEIASGSSMGVVPHLTYTAADSPLTSDSAFQVFAKGALQREYYDYGYTLSGNDDIAPKLGVTVGVNVGI